MKDTKKINIELAKQAALYAQTIIKKGSTQIDNNKLSTEKFDALTDGIDDRRDLLKKELKSGFSLNIIGDKKLDVYEKLVNSSAKYSLGNCYEMALQAFDYLLYSPAASQVNFEIFTIQGGDHIFDVIGRNPKTDPSNPKTWNKDAVICDPWNEKNNVYLASEYQQKLKSWRREIKEDASGNQVSVKNAIDDFDEKKHTLVTGESVQFTATQIRELKTGRTAIVKQNFQREATLVRSMLSKLQFKINRAMLHHPSPIMSDYLDKLYLAEKGLISVQKAVANGNTPMEFRTLASQLTSELEIAYPLLFPSSAVCEILAYYDKIASYPRPGLFYSTSESKPVVEEEESELEYRS